ncbi:MAG: hypothetical protein LBC02_08950 [Planctomycetaceae bacterium]|jgi:hypothetical protein|nr:hypothetical protein [Planctomycetaceae bacterium]
MRAIVLSISDGYCGSEAGVIVGQWYQYICFCFSFTFPFRVSYLIIGDDWSWIKPKTLNQTGQITA